MEEIEVKFLDCNHEALIKKLEQLGARKEKVFLYNVKSYDYVDKRLAKDNAWVRLRDDGEHVSLSYKQRLGVGEDRLKDGGMKEIEMNVESFVKANEFLTSIGLIAKFFEEKRRTRYVFDGVEVDLDEVPLLPPYIELEGESWESLERVAERLDLRWEAHVRCSAMQMYEHYGLDENDYSLLMFDKQVKKTL